MSSSRTLREALQGLRDVRLIHPRDTSPAPALEAVFEGSSEDAETLDGRPFLAHPVKPCEETGFTHFLDGAQRVWTAGYDGLLPILIAHISAALCSRVDRTLEAPEDRSYRGETIAFVSDSCECGDILPSILPTVHVEHEPDEPPQNQEAQLRQAVNDHRDFFEREVAQEFTNGRLLMDGGIQHGLRSKLDQAYVVGVVKSHARQYFKSAERVRIILDMKEGERSTVFVREASPLQGPSVYSFYLRLREPKNQGPLFGLVRVEVPKETRFVDDIDVIAGWLLHERSPLSLPDSRFDRLLYPIRLLEQHLKARQPSDAAIRGLIGL
jgi:hypothetical protein